MRGGRGHPVARRRVARENEASSEKASGADTTEIDVFEGKEVSSKHEGTSGARSSRERGNTIRRFDTWLTLRVSVLGIKRIDARFPRSRLQGDRFVRPAAGARRVGLFPTRRASPRRARSCRDTLGGASHEGRASIGFIFPPRAPSWSPARAARAPTRRSFFCGGFRTPTPLRPRRSRACGTCPAEANARDGEER